MKLFGWEISKAPKMTPAERQGEATAASMYVMPWQVDRPLPMDTDPYALVRTYKSWVYVCASKNAQSVAKVPLKLYVSKKKGTSKLLVNTKSIERRVEDRLRSISGLQQYVTKAEKIEEVVDHPFYDLIKNVNPMINRFDLWELTQLFLELTGNAYWYVVQNALGSPALIYIVPTQGMKIIPGKENTIKGYMYEYGLTKVPFEPEEIIQFKFNSLTSQLYGYSPMRAAIEAYAFDQRIKVFESTLLANNARPEGFLTTEQPITDTDFDRMKARWQNTYEGERRAGKTLILEKGLKYQPITMSPKEINYAKGRQWNREEIAAIFGVPMSKLTPDNVNKANAEAGDYQHASDTIEPRLRRLEEKMNERLMPMYDDSGTLFCVYDPSVPEDKEYRLREINAHLQSGFSTINMERALDKLPPVDWGDLPIMQQGMVHFGTAPPATSGGMADLFGAGPSGTGMPMKPGETKPPKVPPAKPPEKPSAEELAKFADIVVERVKKKLKEG